jgi:putative MATE family efflux protein
MERQQLVKKTFALALPAITDMFIQMLFGIVDMAMVGSIGAFAIAAIGLSDMPMMTIMAVFAAISVGATALSARAIGAKKPEEANRICAQSLLMNATLSMIAFALIMILASWIIRVMGADAEIYPYSLAYMRITAFSLPFMANNLVLAGVLRGSGDTKTPMKFNAFGLVLNVILNFLLIFPSRDISVLGLNIWMPGMGLGVTGAALGTTIARTASSVIWLLNLAKGKFLVRVNKRDLRRFDIPLIRRILNIGLPAAIEQFLMRLGQLMYSRLVVSLGTLMFAAHRITITAESLSFYIGFGFSLAGTTLVGQYLGAKDAKTAECSGHIAASMAMLFMGSVGVIFFFFPELVIRIFTDEEEIIQVAKVCLRIVAVAQPFLAAVMAYAGSLRGAGDTRAVLWITLIGIWGVRVFGTYLVIKAGYGLVAAWVMMTLDLIVRGSLLFGRFMKGKWKTLKV